MKKIFFLFLFVASACVFVLALPTVDIGNATTTASTLATALQAIAAPAWTYIALRALIAVASALKSIFPHIDGK